MSFVVSARKYRPKSFDELIGQDHVASTLKNAILNDKLGKTTTARILAKVLNCNDRQEGVNACDKCSACKAFSENASFNIFELDAASNNSVEHIRALNDQVRFQPQQGSYKIYIIDEVHMLSQAAFNAFLKTLEEPPPYAKFILATTEKHKIIPTILSRCQTFDFKRISVTDIVQQLQGIVDKEEKKIDDRSLHLIAEKADGAMRDALSIYDKVSSSLSGDISYSDVARNLNELDKDHYFKMVDHALKEDMSSMMVALDEIAKNGFEIEQFCTGLMTHMRNLLFIQDSSTAGILEVSKEIADRYTAQSALCSSSFLLTALNIMDRLDMNLPRIQNKRLSMEISLSKIAYMNRRVEKKKETENNVTKKESKQSSPIVNVERAQEKQTEAKTPQIEPKSPPAVAKEKVSAKKAPPTQDNPNNKATKNETPSKSPQAPEKKKVGAKAILPKLDVDISGIIASIEDEEVKQRAIINPFTPEFILNTLEEWKASTSSNALQTALNFIKVDVDKNKICIITPLSLYAEMIRQETDLIQSIRDHYPLKDLQFEFTVDQKAFPEMEPPKQRRLLSFPEKYEKLKEKNPAFEELFKELKLKPKK